MRYLKIYEDYNQFQKMIDDTRKTAEEHGVKVYFPEADHVLYNGIGVSGYFIDNGEPTIACAISGDIKVWGAVMAHESSHMDQWIENSKYWTENYIDGKEAVDWMDQWCAGKVEFTDGELDDIIRRAIGVELDCEKRTIEKEKKYGLPLDPIEETQKAVSYIWFYRFVKDSKKWNDIGKAPYLIKEVWSQMPKTFDIDYMEMPEKIKNLYYQYCFNKTNESVDGSEDEDLSRVQDLKYCFDNIGDQPGISIEVKGGGFYHVTVLGPFKYNKIYNDIMESIDNAEDSGFKWWRSWLTPDSQYYAPSGTGLRDGCEDSNPWLGSGIPKPSQLIFEPYPLYKKKEYLELYLKPTVKTQNLNDITFLFDDTKSEAFKKTLKYKKSQTKKRLL